MGLLLIIILFSTLGSVVSVFFAAIVLIIPQRIRQILIPLLISYAAGTLLGAAFIGLLPESIELSKSTESITGWVLGGILLFFIMEKLVLWRHCHKQNCQVHDVAGPLILIGDAVHNLIDGVVIASTFLVSVRAGIAVSVAVIAHEVPQEIGDFALLIDYGFSRKAALLLNLLSSATTVAGAIVAYYALSDLNKIIPYVMAISSAGFIYIALADIFPGLNKRMGKVESVIQILLIFTGIITILAIRSFDH